MLLEVSYTKIVASCYKNHNLVNFQTKDVDLHFSLSDALILCLEGISSPEKCDAWKNMKSEFVRPPMPEENLNLLNWLMDELVTLTPQPHPNIRQAVCVIFLSVLKRLSYLPAVKDKLSSIQYVFMELLSENNGRIAFQ